MPSNTSTLVTYGIDVLINSAVALRIGGKVLQGNFLSSVAFPLGRALGQCSFRGGGLFQAQTEHVVGSRSDEARFAKEVWVRVEWIHTDLENKQATS